MLNTVQQEKIQEIWQHHQDQEMTIMESGESYTATDLRAQREETLPLLQDYVNKFVEGDMELEELKAEVDSLNKRYRLWEFKGLDGQMFFNALVNLSSGTGLMDKLTSLLRRAISLPGDIVSAKQKIELLENFTQSLEDYLPNGDVSPRRSACNYFLSYFWQVQDAKDWPVYYSSLAHLLEEEGLWTPTHELKRDYESYYELFRELESEWEAGHPWDVEFALRAWKRRGETSNEQIETVNGEDSLPGSFVPPIVGVLPPLARRDKGVVSLCERRGQTVEEVFTSRLSDYFRTLGYEVRRSATVDGHDGIALCREHRYALLYMGRVSSNGYTGGPENQSIKEPVKRETQRLRQQGVDNVYFLVVSHRFKGDFDADIRALKIDTDVREVVFVEASALVTLLSQKLRDPYLNLGPRGVQNIFAESGVLTLEKMREFLGV